jgi:hypothetical protein
MQKTLLFSFVLFLSACFVLVGCGGGNTSGGGGGSGGNQPSIVNMLGSVSQSKLISDVNGLTGNSAITVGGSSYTVTSRTTGSASLQKVTQWAFERLQAAGYTVSYQNWTGGSPSVSDRNVIGENTGLTKPSEIVILYAHMDAVWPGADDNASGAAAVLNIAEAMASYRFDRTIRFILFTGEEKHFLGSTAYANSLTGQDIVATINLDCIGVDSSDGPVLRLFTRESDPGKTTDTAIANVITSAINTYGLPLTPHIMNDEQWQSDSLSFWAVNIPTAQMIEDVPSDTGRWNGPNDTPNTLNFPYLINMTKAALAGFATEAQGLAQSNLAYNPRGN